MKKLFPERLLLMPLCLAYCACCLGQQLTDSVVLDRVRQRSLLSESALQLVWQNPVVAQWQRNYSISDVAIGYQWRHESQAVVVQLGNHDAQGTFDAETHIKHRTRTLWGRAHYDKGSTRGIAWNETSDIHMVYPYLMADSAVLAPMRHERYGFGGGYADHRGRWQWGGEVDYRAGHYYRNVDPRPRNITACLTVKGGVGWSLSSRYVAAAALAYQRYKQTNDVVFYSELGKEKLFHLTGLANDYGRFAGAGDESFYRAHQWQVMVGVHPFANQGLSVAARASRMSLDKVLTSLNKLPLAHIAQWAVDGEMAWLEHSWNTRMRVEASRRVGRENIFGDPAASVYPMIGSLDMYHENRFAACLDGVWQHRWRNVDLGVKPAVDYAHVNTIYADPAGRQCINSLTPALALRGGYRTPSTYSTLLVQFAWTHPVEQELMLSGVKAELTGLQQVLESDHRYASHNRTALNAALAVHVALSNRYALQAAVDWCFTRYTAGAVAHRLKSSVAIIF